MRKNVIALLLTLVMASSSVGTIPVLAVETTAEGAVAIEEESVEESAVEEQTVEEQIDATDKAEDTTDAKVSTEDSDVENKDEDTDALVEEASEDESRDEIEGATIHESEELADNSETADVHEEVEDKETAEEEVVANEEIVEESGKEASLAESDGDVIASGDCSATEDDHVTWRIIGPSTSPSLIISGNGHMKDYDKPTVPWIAYKTMIYIKRILHEEYSRIFPSNHNIGIYFRINFWM